jgi:drug/metabolite transporter (DMT)-like permease
MLHLLLGLGIAFAGAACYAVGISYQAREARRVGLEHSLRLSLFRRLIRRPAWVLGVSIDGCGWALQAVALTLAPLTIVQPALAVGLVFLLVIGARMLGERIGRREVVAVLAIAGGLAGIGYAAPAHSTDHASSGELTIAFAALAAVAVVPYVAARRSGRGGISLAACAGLAFACDGLATKLMTDDLAGRAWVGVACWLAAMVAFAGLGTLSELSALQTTRATRVAPVVFVLNTLIPVGLAPVLGGEIWSSVPVLAVSVVAVAAGGMTLAHTGATADRINAAAVGAAATATPVPSASVAASAAASSRGDRALRPSPNASNMRALSREWPGEGP